MSDLSGVLSSALGTKRFPIGEERQYRRGDPRPETKFMHLIPRGDAINQGAVRGEILSLCEESKEIRDAVTQMCKEDFLFFLNCACWVFEPRTSSRLPLCTWADQEWILLWLEECFGDRDAGVEKTRGVGLSWDIAALCYWHWLFDDDCQIGLVSRTEDAVDLMDDPDSLMWKLDYLFKHTPRWLAPKDILDRTYSTHRFLNTENGSCIRGYAADGNVMTGGRKKAAFFDEFGKFDQHQQQFALDSSQHVTNSRFFISTFKKAVSRFYQMMRTEKSSMLKIIADWRDNEVRSRGLYTVYRGEAFVIDNDYHYPKGYKYVTGGPFFFGDGELRSVWFDAECDRAGATPESIAEELCRVPVAPGSKLFSSDVLANAEKEMTEDPKATGEVDYSTRTWDTVWVPRSDGRLRLWIGVDSRGNLEKRGPYAFGCDVSTGSGTAMTSNSVCQAIDVPTGEQVAEYCANDVDPVQFAQIVYSMTRWFAGDNGSHWVYVNWESNGIGGVFTREWKRLGWGNNYVGENITHRYRKKKTARLGWHNQDGGEGILLEMQRAMAMKELTIRSSAVIADCRPYERNERGKVVHGGIQEASSQSHGDRAGALAIAWLAAKDRSVREGKYRVDDQPQEERWDLPTELSIVRDDEWWSELTPLEVA